MKIRELLPWIIGVAIFLGLTKYAEAHDKIYYHKHYGISDSNITYRDVDYNWISYTNHETRRVNYNRCKDFHKGLGVRDIEARKLCRFLQRNKLMVRSKCLRFYGDLGLTSIERHSLCRKLSSRYKQ